MALKTKRWDSAKYLKSETDMLEYLNACLEEAPEDAAFLAHALGVVARAGNFSALARETELSREGLRRALSKAGNPTLETVMRVTRALGFRLTFEQVRGA